MPFSMPSLGALRRSKQSERNLEFPAMKDCMKAVLHSDGFAGVA